MALFPNPGITNRKLMVYLKTLLIITLQLTIMISVSGCMNSDEKNYAGTAKGEFALHYDLAMKYSGEDKMMYELKVIPTNNEMFMNQLNKKWHDEARLKFSAYDKLKEYCETYKDYSMCSNYDELKKEIESKDVSVFFNIKLYEHNKKEIDNISGKFSFDLNNQQVFKENWIKVANSASMNRSRFRKIEAVELHIK